MAMDKLNEMIGEMKNNEDSEQLMPGLVALLESARDTLPDDADEGQIDDAIRDCIRQYMSESVKQALDALESEMDEVDNGQPDDEDGDLPDWLLQDMEELDDEDEDEDDSDLSGLLRRPFRPGGERRRDISERIAELEARMEAARETVSEEVEEQADIIEEHFRESGLYYRVSDGPVGTRIFDLPFTLSSCSVRMRVIVTGGPKSVIFLATLPISVDKTYLYPVTRLINDLNCDIPFGAFTVDEKDGAVELRHHFISSEVMNEETFKLTLVGLLEEVTDNFRKLSRAAAGKFDRGEKRAVMAKCQKMLDELKEE